MLNSKVKCSISQKKFENYLKIFFKSFILLEEEAKKYGISTLKLNTEKINEILKEYEEYCTILKNLKKNTNTLIDSHKIAAIFTLLIIKHKLVYIDNQKEYKKLNQGIEITIIHRVPEIVFAYIFAHNILEYMYNISNDKIDFFIYTKFQSDFIKILEYNKINHQKIREIQDINCVKISLYLSALYYFVEKSILLEVKENIKTTLNN